MVRVLLFCVLGGLAISFLMIISLRRFERSWLARTYPLVEAHFARLSVATDNPRLSFRGEQAETIHDFSVGAGKTENDWISLNRICRNQFGEYFHVVISNENGNAYINHLSAERAALALKGAGAKNSPPLEEFHSALSANLESSAQASISSYPVVVRDTKDKNIQAEEMPEGNEDMYTSALLRTISRLPLEKQWFGSLIGFAVSFAFLALTLRFDPRYTINLSSLINPFLVYVGAILLMLVAYKKWQGSRWNERRLFPRLLSFFMHLAVWGMVSAAVIYDVTVWISRSG